MIRRQLLGSLLLVAACSAEAPTPSASVPSEAPPATSPVSPAPPTEEVFNVGGEVRAPVLIQRIEPEYPKEIKVPRQAGVIVLEAIVDRTGVVKDIKIKQGREDLLSRYVVEAVKKWRFSPATRNGTPVSVRFRMTVNTNVR